MRYIVTVDGHEHVVDLEDGRAVVDGTPVHAELRTLAGSAIRSLLVDGRSHTLAAAPAGGRGAWQIELDGQRVSAVALDERTHAIRAMAGRAGGARGPASVMAPMPGLIVRVEVDEGTEVRAGQGVVIMEAMKMENELRAEGAGRVARVHVEPGQTVEKGAVLVSFAAG
jgi:biotin carboxyl carrier protein